jgi:hypothetical protein
MSAQERLPVAQRLVGLRQRDLLEPHLVARAQLSDAVQVGGYHARDLGVAAGGLVLHEREDRLSVRRHLERAQRHPLGEHRALALRRQRGPAQAKPHPARVLAHGEG